jgi:NAD(P)-dependent dehydrogenase (short-subunit alcohol dehydrogenase family)
MAEQSTSVFVITGGAGGMGRACARRLGAQGVLLLTDVVAEPLEQTAQQLRTEGFRVETLVSDVSDEASVQALAERSRALGSLRGIVHTAGLSPTMASWQRIFQVDLVGTARLLRAFLPLAQQDTAVVCIASMAGHLNGTPLAAGQAMFDGILSEPLHADLIKRFEPIITAAPSPKDQAGMAYSLAKHGVISLCQREASAWGARGARLVSLSPGIISTPMGKQEFDQQPMMAQIVAMTPLKRIGRPEEIATTVAFLLSADASFITGCDLLVDGGVTGAMHSMPAPGA